MLGRQLGMRGFRQTSIKLYDILANAFRFAGKTEIGRCYWELRGFGMGVVVRRASDNYAMGVLFLAAFFGSLAFVMIRFA
jgi:hypothetical protein